MASFEVQFSQMRLHQKPQISTFLYTPHRLRFTCGLRNGPRKPMWRTRVLSTEAIQAVQSLKLAQSSSCKLEQVFSNKLSRLLKADLLDTLAELQRQNELDLVLKVFQVFNFVRKEVWYVPELSLFNDMILILGKNKKIEMVEQVFLELRNEGLEPDTRTYTELIGAYFKVEMVKKAMETYELMKASGCVPDKLTFTIVIRNLEQAGEEALTETIKKECADYFDYPEKFIEEVERTFPKRKSLVHI
ncbi:pentatricopeptide repeat-containing protein At1g62350 isoform X1 [Sesamum indicum]|uniref:Pentatricopeptide repeat-containing protein At1g62350 isoform X1 n=1 Tax=Sesamum indicum TaxID=4182 RepID=A0A6I9SU59_SESIN|nr:pentatricopeptide repeat-containing protein At1g62350 isoform X1 [Sesamum indicum]